MTTQFQKKALAIPLSQRTKTLPQIHISHWGGNGPPLLLVHGLAGSSHWWDFAAPTLTSHFEVAALDFSGHGDSDWIQDQNYTEELFLSNINTARLFLGWNNIFLAGHSLGARLSVAYCAQYVKNVRALIAIDFMPEFRKLSSRLSLNAKIRQPLFSDKEAMLNRFHLQPPATVLKEYELKDLARLLIKPLKTGFTWKCDWRTFLFYYDPVWPLLEKIIAPTLIIRGEHSEIMEKNHLKDLSNRIAQCQTLEIPNAYHHVPLDAPKATAEAIIDFAKILEPS